MSTVVALCNKAIDLSAAGHRARADEYGERALVAAEALGAQDCLIVADLRLRTMRDFFINEEALDAPHGTPLAALRNAAVSRFLCTLETLQRRRAAGTLLPGSCRAAEVTWKRHTLEHSVKRRGRKDVAAYAEEKVVAAANMIGLDAFVHGASISINAIVQSLGRSALIAITAKERLLWDTMADACHLMALRDLKIALVSREQINFIKKMRVMIDGGHFFRFFTTDIGGGVQRLVDAWNRLERSGGIPRRIDALIEDDERSCAALQRVCDAAAAAPGLHTCALAGCGAREQHPRHFKACAACKIGVYCSKEHQLADWPEHKAACKAARKAAAAGSAGASGA